MDDAAGNVRRSDPACVSALAHRSIKDKAGAYRRDDLLSQHCNVMTNRSKYIDKKPTKATVTRIRGYGQA
jgi:hypothetical protein